jgi:hypothetical protein
MPAVDPPLGIFRDGRKVADAPEDPTLAYELRERVAAEYGDGASYEVLQQCRDHPDVSQVDCLDCDPDS